MALLERDYSGFANRPTVRSHPNRQAARAVESSIVAVTQVIIWYGWYLSVLEIGVGWLLRREKRYVTAAVYIIFSAIFIPFVSWTHLYLSSGRKTHSSPQHLAPPRRIIDKPYESRSDGSLNFCDKGECGGRWKPPGTHHCSTCGVCRLDFDHHCPWLANCVSSSRMKAFLLLLYTTPVVVPICVYPVGYKLFQHVTNAISASQADEWAWQFWWDRWYSWVFVGGPPGRWFIGAILGFDILKHEQPISVEGWFDGSIVEYPHTRIIFAAAASLLLCVFAFAMAVVTTHDLLKGQSALESARLRITQRGRPTGRFITIPDYANEIGTTSAVDESAQRTDMTSESPMWRTFPVLPSDRLYDLGWRNNWHRIWRRPAFPQVKSHYRFVYFLGLRSLVLVYSQSVIRCSAIKSTSGQGLIRMYWNV